MTQSPLQGLWETSLIGRLVTLVLNAWEDSLVGRTLAGLAAFAGRVFAGSVFGRIWYSDWPGPRSVAGGLTGGALAGLNRLLSAVGRRLGPWLNGLWETSLLVGLARRVAGVLGPILSTSLLYNAFWGFSADVQLAPDETGRRRTSPLVYVLGLLLGLLPLVPHTMSGISTAAMILGVWGVAGLWLLHRMMQGDYRWRGAAGMLPLALLLLVAAASTVQSIVPSVSFLNLVIWLTAGLLFWLTLDLVRNSRDAGALLGPILVGAMLMSLWGFYQVVRPPVIEESWVDPTQEGSVIRVFASMGNPNYLAEYMTLFLPLAVALWLQNPRRQIELTIPVLMMVAALLLTGSRGGWLAFAIAMALFVLMRFPRWSVFMLLGAVALPLVVPESILTRLASAFSLTDTSNLYRINIWRGVADMLGKYWVLGTGNGAEAFAMGYQEFMLPGARAAHAHNVPLQIFAEMGILGLIAAVWALFAVIRRPFVAGASPRSSFLTAAVPVALIGLLFHGLVDYIWYNPKLLFAFWAVAGLGAGLALGDREEKAA